RYDDPDEDRSRDADDRRRRLTRWLARSSRLRVEGDDGRAANRARPARGRIRARRLLRDGHRVAQGAQRRARGRGSAAGGGVMTSARKPFAIYAITKHGIGIAE